MGQVMTMEILPENYRFLQEHVYTQVGIVLEDNKHYLFESRLRRSSNNTAWVRLMNCAPCCAASAIATSITRSSKP
jgi:hypothetical protein